ncbi:hypothetical protein B0H10DRAFT_2231829 [Mycena sp. CBHHK59/15]|nr:hypothetical protein B0H10DRAFT_2231829 [Mycena sp. CBHHK59/15]
MSAVVCDYEVMITPLAPSTARSRITRMSRCAAEPLTARPKDERRSTRHVIARPGAHRQLPPPTPSPISRTCSPQRISVDSRKDTRAIRSSAGHTLTNGLISARKTLVPPKRHPDRSFPNPADSPPSSTPPPAARVRCRHPHLPHHHHTARSAPHGWRQRTAPSHRRSTERPRAPAPYPRIHPVAHPVAHATQPPPSMRIRTNARLPGHSSDSRNDRLWTSHPDMPASIDRSPARHTSAHRTLDKDQLAPSSSTNASALPSVGFHASPSRRPWIGVTRATPRTRATPAATSAASAHERPGAPIAHPTLDGHHKRPDSPAPPAARRPWIGMTRPLNLTAAPGEARSSAT